MNNSDHERFIEHSEQITALLQKLKQDLSQDTRFSNNNTIVSKYLLEMIDLRLNFRILADGIENNRAMVHLQKEKLEKSKVFLQGLHYYKATLENQINQCKIDVPILNEYLNEPLENINWEEGYHHQEIELKAQLDQIKSKKKNHDYKIQQKKKLEIQLQKKEQLHKKLLPIQVKKLYQEVQETGKLIQLSEQFVQQEETEQIRHNKLKNLYNVLRVIQVQCNLEVIYNNQELQLLQIIIKPNNLKLYESAQQNKLNLQQKLLKIYICALQSEILVIGVDRRIIFTNRQIFTQLFRQQIIKQVYQLPKNQLQRNLNNKYIRVQWLNRDIIIGSISTYSFINKLRQRLFALQLINYLSQNIKKVPFFIPLYHEYEHGLNPIMKKLSVSTWSKITVEQYSQLIHIPTWIMKQINKYKLHQLELQHSSISKQIITSIGNIELQELIYKLKLQDVIHSAQYECNNYYKININYYYDVFTIILIIPINYPEKQSFIRIVQYVRKKQDKKDQKKQYWKNSQVQCKGKGKSRVGKMCSIKILELEQALNIDIIKFQKGKENSIFRLFLQLCRLICLISENQHEKKNNCGI